MNVLCDNFEAPLLSTFTEKRHDWCPLRELPEKIPELKSGYEDLSTSIRRVGWNACLDEILKESQNEGGASKTNPTG